MPSSKPTKHELKTQETRELLLRAAEQIILRDGYERAELGEIAKLAGRTKGAIYAQFKSKEDIFLALIEEHTYRYRAQLEEVFAKTSSIEENIAVLRGFFLERAKDEAWWLLVLEFSLFAMRHPKSKKRLQNLNAGIVYKNSESRIAAVLGEAAEGDDAISRIVAIQSLSPVIAGLVLEAQLGTFLPEKDAVRKVTGRIFDALMGVSTRFPSIATPVKRRL